MSRDERKSTLEMDDNAFRCPDCGKLFSRRENLSRHLKVHDTSKPHQCRTCGKGFTRSDILRRHEALHERESSLPDKTAVSDGKRRKIESEVFPITSQDSRAAVLQDQDDISNQAMMPDGEEPLSFDFSLFSAHDEGGWFTEDFYSAMRETGNEWNAESSYADTTPTSTFDAAAHWQGRKHRQEHGVSDEDTQPEVFETHASSPPNEASEEDRWPFAWNPQSKQILYARPINLAEHHPLYKNHNPKFDINQVTYDRMKMFLDLAEERSPRSRLYFPSLKLVNIFLELFLKQFAPQMPVLHLPTLETDQLPSQLLSVMVVIGAIHSRLTHTRRFSIVLLDVVRQQLQASIEEENSLMRSPMIIFASALVCYTGLWCGNKRAFELAEVGRGAVVSYCRRIGFNRATDKLGPEHYVGSLDFQWRHWILSETMKRLCWTVYALDLQFPALLNLPATISISEIAEIGCPCDEEFWAAPSAKSWKRHLGPASVPPSRSFAAAMTPFMADSMSRGNKKHNPSQYGRFDTARRPLMGLNSWSRFLVAITLQNQVFEYSQHLLLERAIYPTDSEDEEEADRDNLSDGLRLDSNVTNQKLLSSLKSWSDAYQTMSSSDPSNCPTSAHFHACSLLIHRLSFILVSISLADLQDAIGKSGPAYIPKALSNLQSWLQGTGDEPQQVVAEALALIDTLTKDQRGSPKTAFVHVETGPYGIITFFLCHIVLWAFTSVATKEQKHKLLRSIERDHLLISDSFAEMVQAILSSPFHENEPGGFKANAPSNKVGPRMVFRHAAEGLTRLGTWGASLNLAMLLRWRAEMS